MVSQEFYNALHRSLSIPEARTDSLGEGTSSGTHASSDKRRHSQTGFFGVTLHKRTRRYEAHVWCNKQVYLGAYNSPVQAARAHDCMALKVKGASQDHLNFPVDDYKHLLPHITSVTDAEMVSSLRNYSKASNATTRETPMRQQAFRDHIIYPSLVITGKRRNELELPSGSSRPPLNVSEMQQPGSPWLAQSPLAIHPLKVSRHRATVERYEERPTSTSASQPATLGTEKRMLPSGLGVTGLADAPFPTGQLPVEVAHRAMQELSSLEAALALVQGKKEAEQQQFK